MFKPIFFAKQIIGICTSPASSKPVLFRGNRDRFSQNVRQALRQCSSASQCALAGYLIFPCLESPICKMSAVFLPLSVQQGLKLCRVCTGTGTGCPGRWGGGGTVPRSGEERWRCGSEGCAQWARGGWAGLEDLRGLFQPRWCYDSVTLSWWWDRARSHG